MSEFTAQEEQELKFLISQKAMADATKEICDEIDRKDKSGELAREIEESMKAERTWWEKVLDFFVS